MAVYTGHLGQVTTSIDGFPTNTATRLDGVIGVNFQGFRFWRGVPECQGLQDGQQSDRLLYGTSSIVNSATIAPVSDTADGFSVFSSYAFLQQWSVFARYDDIKLSKDVAPNLKESVLQCRRGHSSP